MFSPDDLALEMGTRSFGSDHAKLMRPIDARGGWNPLVVKEPFSGAWQRNIEESRESILGYSTVYACINRIASDIGKLPFQLTQVDSDGIWNVVTSSAYSPVLRKQNAYQTHNKFRESWIISKLVWGNTYVLKQRDNRGVVTGLYILDPCRVKPLVSESGAVFYQLDTDHLSQIIPLPDERIVVPAREIIHDTELCLFHPLCGVPPLFAAYMPATKNLRIQRSATTFFGNKAAPGGILTAPGAISDQTANRLAEYWNQNFTGDNAGRVAVVGDGLTFTAMAENAANSQLVEQLRYSDEQICHAFGVPPFKLGIGSLPSGMKVDEINRIYYDDALQPRIENMETLLDEGLGVAEMYGIECNLEPLLRMDEQKKAMVEGELTKAGIKSPDEARKRFNLRAVPGGASPYLQQQNYSLEALAKRDALPDPFGTATPEPTPQPVVEDEPDPEAETRAMIAAIERRFAEAA